MASRRTLELKTKQRQELAEYRDHDPRPYLCERCGALLKIAGGSDAARRGTAGLTEAARPRHALRLVEDV
jgi:hypothetical protein